MSAFKTITGLAVMTFMSCSFLVACGGSNKENDYAAKVETVNAEAKKKLPLKIGYITITDLYVKDNVLHMATAVDDHETVEAENASLDKLEQELIGPGMMHSAVCELFKITKMELTDLKNLELTSRFREVSKTVTVNCQ